MLVLSDARTKSTCHSLSSGFMIPVHWICFMWNVNCARVSECMWCPWTLCVIWIMCNHLLLYTRTHTLVLAAPPLFCLLQTTLHRSIWHFTHTFSNTANMFWVLRDIYILHTIFLLRMKINSRTIPVRTVNKLCMCYYGLAILNMYLNRTDWVRITIIIIICRENGSV